MDDAVDAMLERGMLSRTEPRFALSDGVILLMCGDDRYLEDIIGFHRKQFAIQKIPTERRKLHTIAVNGGDLWIASRSPAKKVCAGGDSFLLCQLKDAITFFGGLPTICLYAHLQCKFAALTLKLTLEEMMTYHMLAKCRVRESLKNAGLQGCKVVSMLHCQHARTRRNHSYVIHTRKGGHDLARLCRPLKSIGITGHI